MKPIGQLAASLLFGTALLHASPLFAADDLTRSLQVSPDGHFLMQPDGKPFFWLATVSGWTIFVPKRENIEEHIKTRSAQGYNVLGLIVTGVQDGSKKNAAGDEIFLDGDPTRPNPKHFEYIDWIIDRAAHYEMRVALWPAWGSYVTGSHQGGPKSITTKNAEQYGIFLGHRYRDKGIIWMLGGDTLPLWPRDQNLTLLYDTDRGASLDRTIIDYRPVFDLLASGINKGAGSPQFFSFHPNDGSFPGMAEPRTSLYFANRSWLSMNTISSGYSTTAVAEVMPSVGYNFSWVTSRNYEYIRQEYLSLPTRPVIDGESRGEPLPIDLQYSPAKGVWRAWHRRNGAYHSVFAGAAGHTGDAPSPLMNNAARQEEMSYFAIPPEAWREAFASPSSQQLGFLKGLMLSRPYFTRIPDQGLVVGDPGDGLNYISATRARDGSYAMIYSPDGRPFVVDLNKLSGDQLVGWWFDPRTGEAQRLPSAIPAHRPTRFFPPTQGQENDWVLVLDDPARGFATPGLAGTDS